MTVEKILVEVSLVVNPVQTASIQIMKDVEVIQDAGDSHPLKSPRLADIPAIPTLPLAVRVAT